MSFELPAVNGAKIAFKIPNGMPESVLSEDPRDFNVKIDISTNMYAGRSVVGQNFLSMNGEEDGNFSNWIDLAINEAAAVSGLTSCGAIFCANSDFSKVAVGHMSGDVRYSETWVNLLKRSNKIKPYYMVFATGNDGGYNAGEILMNYMVAFDMRRHPLRAPAVKSCGSIALIRASADSAVVFARRGASSFT
jgi:hypothetical protein